MIDRRVLKIIAILTMIIDHIGYSLGDYFYLRVIGRLSFPIFLFLIVEGYFKTKNYNKYLFRLLLLALISEIPFDLLINHKVFNPSLQNVVWLFALVLIMFKVFEYIKKIKEISIIKYLYYLLTICTMIAIVAVLRIEYGVEGILLSSSLFLFKEHKIKYLLFVLSIILSCYNSLDILGIFSLIIILFYNDKKVIISKLEQFLYYIIYPLHLLLIYVYFL